MVKVPPSFRERFAIMVLALASVTAGCAPGPPQNSVQAPPSLASAPQAQAAITNPVPAPNGPAAAGNPASQTPPPAAAVSEAKEAIEAEYQKIMDTDDEAQAEVDRWIRENQDYAAKGAGLPQAELARRIRERFEPVRKAYEDFIGRHPGHAAARVAFGSFLGDLDEEEAARQQLEKALALDPKNPAIYNNLANIYGHRGPVKEAFEYFAKAIQLKPSEPVYYHNFATTVYVFRKDAMECFALNEQQVIEKALGLYSNAMRLDPDNFPLASDVAETYYAIKPLRTDEALQAWTNALQVAHSGVEREGVHIHLARIKMAAGRFAEARAHLNAVTNTVYGELKSRIARRIEERQRNPNETNAAPAAVLEK
ncbi:MAG: tetratricopeptide repeat protein [Verrucomicrobiota bacterium]